jgi:hypothetical protein
MSATASSTQRMEESVLMTDLSKLPLVLRDADEAETLKLIRAIARNKGKIDSDLRAQLFKHPVFTFLTDEDRSVITKAAEGGRVAPLKELMLAAINAIRKNRGSKNDDVMTGWRGMTRRTSEMLGSANSPQPGRKRRQRPGKRERQLLRAEAEK